MERYGLSTYWTTRWIRCGIVTHDPSANANNNHNNNRHTNETTDAGTVLETVGAESTVPTGIAVRPLSSRKLTFAVGQKDGTFDLYSCHNNLLRHFHRS